MDHQADCVSCHNVLHKFKCASPEPDILRFHMSVLQLHRHTKHSEKKVTRERLHTRINALQNTNGGTILIHLEGVNSSDRCLEAFDEFIYNIFPAVTEDGMLSTDTFSRDWLCKVHSFEDYVDFVCLNVNKTEISTLMFNTKVRTDVENQNATHRCILTLLSRNVPEHETSVIPIFRGLEFNGECEDRYREYKSFRPMYGLNPDSPSDLANFIWEALKLKDNVTSMSKQIKGGSYYVGIAEKKTITLNYTSKVPQVCGFEKTMEFGDLKTNLYELAVSDLVVLTLSQGFTKAPYDLFKIEFHPLHSNRYVLEIAVRYFPEGVVFSNRGPLAFMIRDNKICRMDLAEWFFRLKKWGLKFSV